MSYSRPKLSDFYTLSQTKVHENDTLHSGKYIWQYPPPPLPNHPCEIMMLDMLKTYKSFIFIGFYKYNIDFRIIIKAVIIECMNKAKY